MPSPLARAAASLAGACDRRQVFLQLLLGSSSLAGAGLLPSRTPCRHLFSKLIGSEDHVLELGAGYGYFINNVDCRRKPAVDLWEGLAEAVAPGVTAKIGPATELSFLGDHSVGFTFAGNLFEHIPIPDLVKVLRELKRVLKSGGMLNLIQPNYGKSWRECFDDGFIVIGCRPGFLPLPIKSRIPVRPVAIRRYLRRPWKPIGQRVLVRAKVLQS
jgi:SAM-dependent methyltransferase